MVRGVAYQREGDSPSENSVRPNTLPKLEPGLKSGTPGATRVTTVRLSQNCVVEFHVKLGAVTGVTVRPNSRPRLRKSPTA